MPRISVFIPTHDPKRAPYLREAVVSVLENGFEDLELIVSDDSIEGYAAQALAGIKDPRLRLVRCEPPEGLSLPQAMARHRSFAARRCAGDYLFKLDDDDRIEAEFLAACCRFLDEHPEVQSVYTGYLFWEQTTGSRKAVVDSRFFGKEGIVQGLAYIRAVLTNEGGYPLNHKSAGVFRRSAAEVIGFYDHASEDFAFSVGLALHGSVGYIPKPLFIYRRHETNLTRDLYAVWQISEHALEGLKRLRPDDPGFASEWPRLLERCRRALPLFYLHLAFRNEGRRAALVLNRKLREQLRQQGQRPSWLLGLLLVFGLLVPRFAHAACFALYRRLAR